MGIKSFIKNNAKHGFNPKKWVGYDHIKHDAKVVGKLAKRAFSSGDADSIRKESFEEAMKRLNLSEKDIQERIKKAKDAVFIFLLMGGALLAYMVYQWVTGHFLSGFTCLILSLVVFVHAFREHFNAYQMRQRQLGCSYKAWLKSLVKGSK